jgi:cytoskeletal protein CcmA (bactofilin family)
MENAASEEFQQGQRKGLFGKLNTKLNEAIQEGRNDAQQSSVAAQAPVDKNIAADDLALKRSSAAATGQRMIIPENVLIEGAMTSGSDTDISGKIDGDVTVESQLNIYSTSVVTGSVRAKNCVMQGTCEGNMECTHSLELGESGSLNADAMSGQNMAIAGKITGNVNCGGQLRLMASAKVTGNIRARSIVIDEGATFNGTCSMAKPK